MPAFKMTAKLFTLKSRSGRDRTSEIFEKFGQAVAMRALRAFLRATLKRIPVRTGFLRGAFRDIQQFAGKIDYSGLDVANPELRADVQKRISSALDEPKSKAHLNLLKSILGGPATPEPKASKGSKKPKKISMKERLALSKRKQELDKKKSAAEEARFRAARKAHGLRAIEYYYDGKLKVVKTDSSGIPYATPPKDVLKIVGNQIRIFVEVNISYYRINDFYSRIRGAPWGSLDAGQIAIEKSFASAVKNMPPFSKFMNEVQIEMNGSSIKETVIEKSLPPASDEGFWFLTLPEFD